uniref:Uncharacterized protein n=1 Tax=Harveyella mirabilis TaxID=282355 RepID=A0A3S8UW31_9FLOR|nr:hypothetical protein [Harveyella mirabilis]
MTSSLQTFIIICNIKNINNNLNKLKIIFLQLILINEGSYTKIIQYFNNKKIKINILQKYYNQSNKINRNIRYVWLETSIYTILTFAKSLWLIVNNQELIKSIKKNFSIGLSFIDNQIDIYKNIYEIYYCYSQKFEKQLNFKGVIFGKKYTLYYKDCSFITIQEFFSPNIFFYFI